MYSKTANIMPVLPRDRTMMPICLQHLFTNIPKIAMVMLRFEQVPTSIGCYPGTKGCDTMARYRVRSLYHYKSLSNTIMCKGE